MKLNKALAKFIKMHIDLERTNPNQLEKASGINRTTIVTILKGNGKCGPRLDNVMPVLQALHTSLAEFEKYLHENNVSIINE